MSDATFLTVGNAEAFELAQVPEVWFADFRDLLVGSVQRGQRLAALFASRAASGAWLWAVLADGAVGRLHVTRSRLVGDHYPSITQGCPQAHLFEREIHEQFGIHPDGHPWLKPVRFAPKMESREGGDEAVPAIGDIEFFRICGEEVHEVAVGPVHAGIIEPGHFRFQCHGEEVFHLEISLGYQHRGVEEHLVGGPNRRGLAYAETLAGDTTVGHTTAYCQALEALSGGRVPARAQAIRGVALELERLANHTGDLGALAGDVGYLPTSSYCGRIRGDFLNMTAALCGSRFGRGLIRPGGTGFDLDDLVIARLQASLEAALKDVGVAVNLLWDTPSVMARFEDTGAVPGKLASALGLVGVPARACGLEHDVRVEFPTGIYRFVQVPISTALTGDVAARAFVRWLEIQRSLAFVRDQLAALPRGATAVELGALRPEAMVASLVEGWRGEICHVAMTDAAGRFSRYKVVDPSFHNWIGLAMAMRDQQVSDFPLCNKSFNLSYCGHDL